MDTNRDKEVLENIFRKKLFEKNYKKILIVGGTGFIAVSFGKKCYLKNGMLLVSKNPPKKKIFKKSKVFDWRYFK